MGKRSNYFILSLASAVLLSVSWYWHLTVFIFFAFVPLLVLEHKLTTSNTSRSKLKLLGYGYLTFFTWNILVTWWVVYASFGGACMAFIFNSLFMSMVFVMYSNIKNRIGKQWAAWLLIPIWLSWEHWHTIWDLTWTWLTLGNAFAFNHNWVQWYEYTGVSGGSFWILAVNILVFLTIKNYPALKLLSAPVLKIAGAIIIPVFLSYLLLFVRMSMPGAKNPPTRVVVAQPNIDPYNAKFSLDYQMQFAKALNLVRSKITSETDYLVLPETFITEDLNEAFINQSQEIAWFRDSLIAKFPKLKIVTGGNTYTYYQDKKDITSTSRMDEQSGKYYDVFNTAVYIDATRTEVYHKSKLVPGVERMPFPALLKPLEGLAINMGGTMGSLGVQKERAVFTDSSSARTSIAPIVCYESVYGDYTTGYIRKGANLIFIITNDGWWEDTPGYIQHLNYARLRAIENRREIARCANTGISCFIDGYGNIYDATKWWEEAVIARNMNRNNDLTFFSRFGDLLSYCSMALTLLCLGWGAILRFKRS